MNVSWARKDADGVVREHRSQPGPILTDVTGVFAFHRLYRWDENLLVRARGHFSARRDLVALPTLGESRELDLGTLTLGEGAHRFRAGSLPRKMGRQSRTRS